MKAIKLLSCLALFAANTCSVEIKCSYDTAYWDVGLLYTCRGEVIKVENPTTVTDIISGNHKSGRTNSDVKAFTIYNQKRLTTIPQGVENFFSNLEAFRWSHGKISTIDSSSFATFPNLLLINLGNNKIVTLDYDLFQPTQKLQWIYLDNNLLEYVGSDLFRGLNDLTFVDFGINPCIHAWADTPQEIQQLNLQLPIECPLHGVIIKCKYSEYSSSDIGSVYCCRGAVITVENPTTVTEINGDHMKGRNHADVRSFSISGCKTLTKIPRGIEKFFSNLEFFYWHFGSISSIDSSTFQPFPYLLTISLGSNKLTTLDGNIFQHTRLLREISFNYNQLEHVGSDLLTGLIYLSYANFEFNPCTKTRKGAPKEIEEQKRQLLIQCPPFATPDTKIATISTTSEPDERTRIEEVEELRERVEALEKLVLKLQIPT